LLFRSAIRHKEKLSTAWSAAASMPPKCQGSVFYVSRGELPRPV